MASKQTDKGYLQLAFNRCCLRKQFPDLDAALKSPAICTALRRVAENLAKPDNKPSHLRGAVKD
ncbi:MAG TPA: hypothetical protein VK958_06385 [Methylophilus sp.]|uniref:hypothetical protein n=1 Tax=Methylophilus sp. TaxID=29541 RepID=UPI002CCBE54F|nr:hypothetical protein [Methylophilus sp.]HSH86862.1 hypothetical protein [Methylophilus sp.]